MIREIVIKNLEQEIHLREMFDEEVGTESRSCEKTVVRYDVGGKSPSFAFGQEDLCPEKSDDREGVQKRSME